MFGAIMSALCISYAVHSYFQRKVCVCEYATGSDAEGAGEMFKVTLPFDGTPRTEDGKVNYKEDFFGKKPTWFLDN
jgi:asparaginyl-tRNA synthetase